MLFLNDHITIYTPQEIENLMQQLPEWRRKRIQEYKHVGRRAECTLGYLQLQLGLKKLHPDFNSTEEFAYNSHGKPYFRSAPQLHFNISHCKMAVGCIIEAFPCGLDIEHFRQAKETLVRHTMNEAEAEAIFLAEEPDIAFTRLWTQKEAILKLKGTGITGNLQHILSKENLKGIELQSMVLPEKGYAYSWAIQKDI